MNFLALPILFIAIIFVFALNQNKNIITSNKEQEIILLDSPQKATIREKEQDKFIQSFLKDKETEEAWGLFSYGGFSDAGQFKIFSKTKRAFFYFSHEQLMSENKSAQDGSIVYNEFIFDKKDNRWKNFEQTVRNLGTNLEGFQITHFDAFQFDFLHLKKSNKKAYVQRVYFDDPYLRDKGTKNLRNLLTAFNKLKETKNEKNK